MDCYPEIFGVRRQTMRRDGARRGNARRGVARSVVVGLVLLAASVAAIIGFIKWIGPGLPECKPEDLAAARAKWEAARVRDYDITIQLSGRQSGEIKVSVRDGEATAMTRNGVQPKQERTWEPWTVPGMFDTLDVDFENAKKPKEKFGNDAAGVNMRCLFDEQYGYPKKYLHQVMGRHQDLEWEVTEFRFAEPLVAKR